MCAFLHMGRLAQAKHTQWYGHSLALRMLSLLLIRLVSGCFNLFLLFQAGPNNPCQEDWGVNFRALHDLFEICELRENVMRYEVGVQMIEIYNEQVRDLLCMDGINKKYPFSVVFLCLNILDQYGLHRWL